MNVAVKQAMHGLNQESILTGLFKLRRSRSLSFDKQKFKFLITTKYTMQI